MTYTFARVGAVVALTVEDYFPQKKRGWSRITVVSGKPGNDVRPGTYRVILRQTGIEEDRT
jgi:hypothetical protein